MIVDMIIGVYLIAFGLILNASDTPSKLLFKVVPVLCGMALILQHDWHAVLSL